MNRFMPWFTLVILFFVNAQITQAAIISGTHFTAEGKSVDLQGLEWLSLDHTQGLSRQEVERFSGFTDRFGTYYEPGEWRYASREETERLINSLWGGIHDGWSATNGDGALWFKQNFQMLAYDTGLGDSRVDGTWSNHDWTNRDFALFVFGNQFECLNHQFYTCAGRLDYVENYAISRAALNVNTLEFEDSYTAYSGQLGWFSDFYGGDFGWNDLNSSVITALRNTDYGHLLVRSASIPEPMTIALFGLGLAGLGFSKRKRG